MAQNSSSENAAPGNNSANGNEIEISDGIDAAELESVPAKPAKAMTLIMRRLETVVGKFKLRDDYLATLEANASAHTDETEPTARGRRINMPELTRIDNPVEIAITKCPKCGTPLNAMNPETRELIIQDLGGMIDVVKAVMAKLTAMRGGSVKLGYHAYRCRNCGTVFSGRPENADHPFCPGREISTNSILEIGYGQSLGFSINAAGKNFEKNAKMGSNTISMLLHDVDHYVMEPVSLELKNILATQEAIGADETPFAIKQAMGVGRMPHKMRHKEPPSSLT